VSHSYPVIAFDTEGQWILNAQRKRRPLISGEIRVKIHAFGLNRADLLQKAGYYPAPDGIEQDILGLEFAGEVIEVSSSTDSSQLIAYQNSHLPSPNKSLSVWQIGDRVMGICAGEGYAREIIMPAEALMPIANHWSWVEAAAIPEAYLTAFDALFNVADLREGQNILIHAIGSGVGLAAAHLATWKGAHVYATSRSQWKLDKAQQTLAMITTVLSQNQQFLTDHLRNQMHVIIDFIGGAYLKQNLKGLQTCGHLVVVGLLGGSRAELPLGLLLAKRAHISGTVLRSRPQEEKNKLIQNFMQQILPNLYTNVIAMPEIHQVFHVDQIQVAHQLLAENKTWSKLIMTWDILSKDK
jgi:NADPH:quinone reductase